MTQLKSFLVQSGIRQAALAERLGISKGYMSELVSGDKTPGRVLALKIETATLGAVPVMAWDHPSAHATATPDVQDGDAA